MSRIIHDYINENSLMVRCFGNDEELRECFEKMLGQGLAPLNFEGHAMKYSFSCMSSSAGYKAIISRKQIIDCIVTYDGLDEKNRGIFRKKHEDKMNVIDRIERNGGLSFFFVRDDTIKGVLYLAKVNEKEYCVPFVYVDSETKYEMVVPLLIAVAVYRMHEKTGDDFSFMLCPSYENGYNGFISVFGKPEFEEGINDYAIAFNSRSSLKGITDFIDSYNAAHDISDSPLKEYYGLPEMRLVSLASAVRFSYLSDLSEMPQGILNVWEKELKNTLDKWKLPFEMYRQKALHDCGRAEKPLIENADREEIDNNAKKTDSPDADAESIETVLLPYDSDALPDIVPEAVRFQVRERQMDVVAALSPQHEVVGLAIVDYIMELGNISYLKYAYVLPGQKPETVMEKLTAVAVDVIRRKHFHSLYLKSLFRMDGEKMFDLSDILEKSTVLRSEDTSWNVCFGSRHFKKGGEIDSKIQEMIGRQAMAVPEVVFQEEPDRRTLNIFGIECWENGYAFDINNYDKRYTGFIYDGVRIAAAIFAGRVSDRELVIRGVYISKQLNTGLASLTLIAAIFKKAAEELADNSFVVLRMLSRNQVELMSKLIGEPDVISTEKEYFYKLLDADKEDDSDEFDESSEEYEDYDEEPEESEEYDEESEESEEYEEEPEAAFEKNKKTSQESGGGWSDIYKAPEDISMSGFLAEKRRIASIFDGENVPPEYYVPILLDISSYIPGNKICTYIREQFWES